MELGLTFPLQRFLGIKNAGLGHRAGPALLLGPACHPPAGAAGACWPSTATAATPLSAGMCPLSSRRTSPGLFRAGLADSLTAAGLSPSRVEGYLEKAGPACLTRTHGRREVAFLNRAWEDVLALDLCLDTERQAQPLLDRAVNTCSSRCAGFEGLGTGLERISASLL